MKCSTFRSKSKKHNIRICTQGDQIQKKGNRLSTQPTCQRQSIRASYRATDRSQMSVNFNSFFRVSPLKKLPPGIKNILKLQRKIEKLHQTRDDQYLTIKQTQKQNILKTFRNNHKKQNLFNHKINLQPAQKLMINFQRQMKRIKKKQFHNKNDQIKQNKDKFQAFSMSICKQKVNQNQDCVKFGDGIHVLCDGHGSNGKQVSKFVCQNIFEKCFIKKKENKINKGSLTQIFMIVSRQLEFSGVDIAFSGSTCLVVICLDRQIFVANVGDSKAILRKQHKTEILSNQHRPQMEDQKLRIQSVGGVIRQMQMSKGKFSGPLRIWAPGKNSWGPGLAISRCFGNKAGRRYGLICQPQVSSYKIVYDEHFLVLGTGGLFEGLKMDQIVSIVKKQQTHGAQQKQRVCEELGIQALKKSEEDLDDISVLLIYV